MHAAGFFCAYRNESTVKRPRSKLAHSTELWQGIGASRTFFESLLAVSS